MIRRMGTSRLTPKIRQEVMSRADGVCECRDLSHKHLSGRVGCTNVLPAMVPFHPTTNLNTIVSKEDVAAVCQPCAHRFLSSGGRILW